MRPLSTPALLPRHSGLDQVTNARNDDAAASGDAAARRPKCLRAERTKVTPHHLVFATSTSRECVQPAAHLLAVLANLQHGTRLVERRPLAALHLGEQGI